jgi:hypothetical protein
VALLILASLTDNMKILLISNLNYKVLPNKIPMYALLCLHFKDSFPLVIFVMKMFVTIGFINYLDFLGQHDNMKTLLISNLNYKVEPNKIPLYALMCMHLKDSNTLAIFAFENACNNEWHYLLWPPWETCNMKILLISNLNYKVEENKIPLYALMCMDLKDSNTLAIFAFENACNNEWHYLPWPPWQHDNMKTLLISNLNYKVEPNRIPLNGLMGLHFKDSFPLEIFAMKILVTISRITYLGFLEQPDSMGNCSYET